ncbi:hypothetical protein Ddc_09870 [Ditylenchus destructor]|nr:hypothetical protein Ddc_09870 [Ditylenchus destructor]
MTKYKFLDELHIQKNAKGQLVNRLPHKYNFVKELAGGGQAWKCAYARGVKPCGAIMHVEERVQDCDGYQPPPQPPAQQPPPQLPLQ